MNVVGGGFIQFFGPEDEGAHPVGDSEWWNESVWLHFLDIKTGVSGVLRIGHEPNWQGGHSGIWSMISTPNWIHKRDGLYPLRSGDRTDNGFKSNGTHSFEFDGKRCHWTIKDGECFADLYIDDYHPPLNIWPAEGVVKTITPNHTEGGGKVSGTIVIKGDEYRLTDALGYRDHSWGTRVWDNLRTHRWVSTTFGPDCNCNALCYVDETNKLGRYGYIRRGDTVFLTQDIDVVAYMEPDGITHRGGVARYKLSTDEVIEMLSTPVSKALISRHHKLALNDTICVTHFEGRVGATCFETNNNLQAGELMPLQRGLVRGIVDNGIWPASSAVGT